MSIRSARGKTATARLQRPARRLSSLRRQSAGSHRPVSQSVRRSSRARKAELVEQAHLETALPASPRLADVELPRTINQLRQAADAALEGSWALPTIDTKLNIRSVLAPIGPVAVFGPNNFPFAFNGAAGGDFAAAIAAGNPVIAKGHPLHAGTSRMLAEEAIRRGCRSRPASGNRAAALSHQARVRLAAGGRSPNRRDGIHGKPLGRPGA